MTSPEKPKHSPGPSIPPTMVGLPLDSVPIGIALSQRGTYLQANMAFLKMFGYEHEIEVLGRPLLDFVATQQRGLVRELNQERERTGTGPSKYEILGRRKDGSTFPMLIRASTVPVANGVGTLAFVTDISERKAMEAKLRESEEKFRTYVEQSIDVIFTLDAKGNFLFLSPAWDRQFGLPSSELIGTSFVHVIDPEDVEPCMHYLVRVLATGQPETSPPFRVRHSDGSWPRFVANGSVMQQLGGEPVFLGVAHDITKEYEAGENLAQANLLLEQSQTISRTGAWALDPVNKRLTWTPESYRLHEVDPQVYVPTLESALAFYEPESRPVVSQAVQKAIATGQGYELELSLRTAKGRVLWIRTIGTAVFEKGRCVRLLGTIQDITDRKKAEDALRESEQQLQVIFEASEAGIMLISSEGLIHYTNRRMAEMFGLSMEALTGTAYGDYLHGFSKQAGLDRLSKIISGEVQSTSIERRFLRADGTDFWGHLSGRRLENPDGSLRALVAVITDITDHKRAEEEQQFLQSQLHQAQKMESLGALAGGVAHDMNNVLGAILGLASAHIEAQPTGSPVQRAFGTIIKAAERGGNMLKGLLSFARQSSAEERDLDLNAILREEVRLLERTTLSKVRLVMDLDPELRLIRADAGALTHAFMNLCVNAVDAMPENGTLTLRTRNLGSEWAEVQVQDTGTGMPPEVLAKALDPFFTTKEVGKGTGLGLSIVYSTVKAHQGEMELQSEPGQGTCVIMRFPAMQGPPRPAEPSGAYQTLPHRGALQVLLVDDDELIQGSIEGMLEHLGHRASLARSGEEALALLKAGLKPDVVILDMNMPGLGGAGTLPYLRTTHPRLPVLLVTGRADQAAQNLVQAHGLVTLLSKPFGMKELQAHLDPFVG